MKKLITMRNLIFLFILLFSVSCMTVKRIEKNCDVFQKICLIQKDTIIIRDSIVVTYRDTLIRYFIKRDTVYQETPVYVKQGIINSDISHLEVGLAKSEAWVKLGVLSHFLESGDTTLQIRLDNALRNVKELRVRLEKRTSVVTIKENTKFALFTIKWFWISFFVILILVLILMFKSRVLKIFK